MNYEVIPSVEVVERTAAAMRKRNVDVHIVKNRAEALEKIKELIPRGAAVMNGSSTTLEEIGFIEYLKSGTHGWNNVHDAILAEKDSTKQAALRAQSIYADYFLSSVHAIAESGQTLTASATGSQIPSYAFTSKNVIWVAGVQKITPTPSDALERIRNYVFQKEDRRMKNTGASGSVLAKILIFECEPTFTGRKITMVLVHEKLGF